MKTIRIFIEGGVQGVFFRAFIKERADNLGLTGYVKNLDDGRVEVAVEGRENNINKMIEACKRGPPHSKIKDIEIEKLSHQGFKEFKVIRF
jgi:acylphosphatase